MSGTSSAVMAAARVSKAVLDARPAFGSWAAEKLGLAPTGVNTRADCMAASFLPSSMCCIVAASAARVPRNIKQKWIEWPHRLLECPPLYCKGCVCPTFGRGIQISALQASHDSRALEYCLAVLTRSESQYGSHEACEPPSKPHICSLIVPAFGRASSRTYHSNPILWQLGWGAGCSR